jgi:hypothetical protein
MLPGHIIQYAEYRIDNTTKKIAELELKLQASKLEFETTWYARLFRMKYDDDSWSMHFLRQALSGWVALKNAAVYQEKMGYEKFDYTGFNEFYKPAFYNWCAENNIPW